MALRKRCALTQAWRIQGVCAWVAALLVTVATPSWSAPDDSASLGIPLGPGDSIAILARDAPEIEGTWRISPPGYLQLPMVGRIAAAGVTPDELREVLQRKLAVFVVAPDVSVALHEVRSRPVTVSGGVANPGVYQLERRLTLFDSVPLAGGVTDPGPTITLKRACDRGAIPHDEASECDEEGASNLTVRLEDVAAGRGAAAAIELIPRDSVIVSQSIATDRLYVTGEVRRPGVIELVNRDEVSLSQAIAMAGGYMNTAKASQVVVRQGEDGKPEDPKGIQTVNLKDVLSGAVPDVQLRAGYIVYVPPKNAVSQALLGAVSAFGSVSNGLVILGRL